jgi:6,7-dimethyl-8-ribityllumazine synthase
MATAQKNLSYFDKETIPDPKKMRFGIVVSEWNNKITSNLLKGAVDTLKELKVPVDSILIHHVPGAFELPIGAQYLLEFKEVDGVIALGSIIQGETKHFDFVCNGTTQGIMNVSLKYNKPIIYGVLTDDNMQQAMDRSGGKHGNKGIECAIACIKMISLKNRISSINAKIGF